MWYNYIVRMFVFRVELEQNPFITLFAWVSLAGFLLPLCDVDFSFLCGVVDGDENRSLLAGLRTVLNSPSINFMVLSL